MSISRTFGASFFPVCFFVNCVGCLVLPVPPSASWPFSIVPTESIKRKSKPQWEPYRDKNATPEKSKNGFAIAGFVMSFFWFLAPLAFVFSIIGMQSEKRGLAIAGIVLSGLTLLVFLIALILYLTGYI